MHPLMANSGVPMIGVQMSLMTVALLPIIVIEALVLRARLSKPFSQSLRASLLANLLSTFVGVPMTWFVLLFAELAFDGGAAWGLDTPLKRIAAVTLQSPWLVPYENELHWMVPAATLVLMVPFFVASVVVEAWAIRRLWPEVPRKRVWTTAWLANALSYVPLIGFTAAWLSREVGGRR